MVGLDMEFHVDVTATYEVFRSKLQSAGWNCNDLFLEEKSQRFNYGDK